MKIKRKIFGNNYQILKELGKGGMGAVYLARDIKQKKQVAIKVLSLSNDFNQDMKSRAIYSFKREALAIASLNHTNIVNIFDIGNEDEDTYYIVMELIEGQPISKIIQIHPLPIEMVLSLAVQVCDALSYIHKNKVIHRDIKTENIMLLGGGLAKLTDFGIAKFEGEEKIETTDSSLVGTILYMSPEQLNDPDDVDERTDLYSFAVTMYEMLTGKLPIQSNNVSSAIIKILKEIPNPPSLYNPMIPDSLDKIILKALSKDREQRQNNLETFSKEIRAIPEYKDFLEIIAMQFAQNFNDKSTSNIKSEILDKISILDQESIDGNKENIVTDDPFINLLDLGWSFTSQELETFKNKKSIFIESLKYIIPMILSDEVRTFISNTKSLSDTKELLAFLNSFDGHKSFKEVVEEKTNTNLFEFFIESARKNLIVCNSKEILDSLAFIVDFPETIKNLIGMLKNEEKPNEILYFLEAIDNNKSLFQIIDETASLQEIEYISDFFYKCYQKGIVSAKIEKDAPKHIFIGDMLFIFSYITNTQANLAIKESKENNLMSFEDVLLENDFVTIENLLNTIKLKLWYKKLFSQV